MHIDSPDRGYCLMTVPALVYLALLSETVL